MLYITSPGLTDFYNWKFVPFDQILVIINTSIHGCSGGALLKFKYFENFKYSYKTPKYVRNIHKFGRRKIKNQSHKLLLVSPDQVLKKILII